MECRDDEESASTDWSPIFQFDVERLRLRNAQSGRQCALTRNEALLLDALVAGVCTKSDLIDEVWTRHGTVVTENSYYQLVSLLRKSFASIDLPGTVVTVPRKGLALNHAHAEESSDEPAEKASNEGLPVIEPCVPTARDENVMTSSVTERPSAGEARDSASVARAGSRGAQACGDPLRDFAKKHTPRTKHGSVARALIYWRHRWQSRRRAAGTRWHAKRGLRLGINTLLLASAFTLGATLPHWLPTPRPAPSVADVRGMATVVSGDVPLHYTRIPPETAQRIWRDIQARVDIPPEQRAYLFLTVFRNRYALLACSGNPELPTIRCSTVTESL
ncbi:MAG TPA: hypothetical protein VL424_20375 [Pararobbsia sp.]|nr:hypothetical protein [Pararobbsia sp.]